MKQIKVNAKKLPSGSYRCRVMINGVSKSFTAPTKEEAEAMAEEHIALVRLGLEQDAKDAETIGACIDRYIFDRESILSPSTIRGYKIVRRSRFQSLMSRDIHTVTQQQYQSAINLEAKAVSPKTIRNAWGLMTAVIKENTGKVPEVRLPAAIKNTRPFLDDNQTNIFLEAIYGDPIEPACLLALHSLRCSEILALTWKQIDIETDTITVHGAMVPDENNVLVHRKQNKTQASRRTVPIIIPRLHELAEIMPPSDQIVTCTPNWLYKRINQICEENNLPQVGIHGLRHTFASLCYYAGIPEKAVMDLGGWSNPTVLREIYTHLSARQKNAYIEKLSSLFNKKPVANPVAKSVSNTALNTLAEGKYN